MASKQLPDPGFSSTSKMKSAETGPSNRPNIAAELPFRERPSTKPLGPQMAQDLRVHKSNVQDDVARKKAEEANAWKRRMRMGPGEREDSPIRRSDAPERWPPTWTKEDKANAELLEREAVEVAVYEPERLDQDKTIQHQDFVEVHWDGCKNIDIPWHQFKILPSSVRGFSKLSTIYSHFS